MPQTATGQESPDDLLASIRRLTRIVLDKLEQGSKEGTLDQAQIRLLGSIARSYAALEGVVTGFRYALFAAVLLSLLGFALASRIKDVKPPWQK